MRKSRRLHLGLPSPLEADLSDFARRHGLGLGPAIRLLVGQALTSAAVGRFGPTPTLDSPAALAALTAAEHATLMVASILPEGDRRMHSLAERATEAAAERLALFQPPSDNTKEPA
ncbi:MAG: hypothetical protein M3082_19655 [Candidatus Dormibacteraeota bacterium]|nr:hypothetical protein [Candidatus Dormibacteraeota bacterium]